MCADLKWCLDHSCQTGLQLGATEKSLLGPSSPCKHVLFYTLSSVESNLSTREWLVPENNDYLLISFQRSRRLCFWSMVQGHSLVSARHSSDYHFSLINLNEAAFKKGCRCRNQIIPPRFFNVPEAIISSSECNIFRFFFFTHLHTLSLTD